VGTPPYALLRLVDRFDRGHKVFLSPDYKEEQLRASCPPARHSAFVVRTSSSPFFTALGCTVANTTDTIPVSK